MTERDVDILNNKIEIFYRSVFLKQTSFQIAKVMNLTRARVAKILSTNRDDRRILEAAEQMAKCRQEELDADFT